MNFFNFIIKYYIDFKWVFISLIIKQNKKLIKLGGIYNLNCRFNILN
jgi:hypothetical protein